MKNAFFFLLIASLIFSGCKKVTSDPKAPEIEFGGFNYLEKDANGKDSKVELIIKVKDVNGDIGTLEDERKKPPCGYKYADLFMFYERYENGVYVPDYLHPLKPDTLFDSNCNIVAIRDSFQNEITYALTYIQPEGNNKSIEAEISYLMELRTTLLYLIKPQGRFRIYIQDRAGNKSNEIITDPLIISI
jgi:hypothetical protein